MIKLLILSLCVIFSIMPIKQTNCSFKNIYEAGEPLKSSETNFKNLFNNWNSNHLLNANDFVLINYSFIEEISDTSALELYSRLFTDNKRLIGTVKNKSSFETFFNESVQISEQTFSLRTFESLCDTSNCTSLEKSAMISAFEKERENLKRTFKSIVKVGDTVFVIFFKDKQHIYNTYVVCSNRTNRVIWDNVFRNIKIKNH